MVRALGGRSCLVSVENGAHVVAFSATNGCADEHATTFVVSGTLPGDTFCRRDATPSTAPRRAVADGPMPIG
jgi:TAP-like protein